MAVDADDVVTAFVRRGICQRKRQFRALWIARINAASRECGLTYSVFMNGLKRASIEVDRKVLSDIAVFDKAGFAKLVEQARAALPATTPGASATA